MINSHPHPITRQSVPFFLMLTLVILFRSFSRSFVDDISYPGGWKWLSFLKSWNSSFQKQWKGTKFSKKLYLFPIPDSVYLIRLLLSFDFLLNTMVYNMYDFAISYFSILYSNERVSPKINSLYLSDFFLIHLSFEMAWNIS